MKSFFRKNDFSKNIFWRLACTKKSPTAKKEIWQHPVAVAGFQPNLQNPAKLATLLLYPIRIWPDAVGRLYGWNLARLSLSPAVLAGIQPNWLDFGKILTRSDWNMAKYSRTPAVWLESSQIWPDWPDSG